MPDIDGIRVELALRHPGVAVQRLTATHEADDTGIWFFAWADIEVQLESSSGNGPFLLESDAPDRRRPVTTAAAVSAVLEELGLTPTADGP